MAHIFGFCGTWRRPGHCKNLGKSFQIEARANLAAPPVCPLFPITFFSTGFFPICYHICGQGSFYICPILFSASTEHFQLLLRTFSNRFLLDFSRFAVVFAAMGRFIFVTSNSSASAERFSFFCALFLLDFSQFSVGFATRSLLIFATTYFQLTTTLPRICIASELREVRISR